MHPAFRVTVRSDSPIRRVWCGLMLGVAALAEVSASKLGVPSLYLLTVFCGVVGIHLLVGVVWPHEYELVLDTESLRWGRARGRYRRVLRSEAGTLLLETDAGELAVAILKSGAHLPIPVKQFQPDLAALARAAKATWPEVVVKLRGEIL